MNILKNTVIALAIGLAFTACNSKGNKQSGEAAAAQAETGSSAELKETNAGNWQAVAKENFNLDLSLPAGWTVTEAESPNGQNMMLFCEIDNADSLDGAAKLASVKSFVQAALEASKAASAGAFHYTVGDVEIVPDLSWQWEYTHEPVKLSQEYVATTTMLSVNYNNLNSIEISIALMAKRV